MKFISAMIIFLALAAQLGSRFVVLLDYELNKEYIAKNLCENRNKPKSCCKGKCYLKKQLTKASNEDNTPNSKEGKSKVEELFTCTTKPGIFTVAIFQISSWPVIDNNIVADQYLSSIFHPPQV